jgi:3-oxoacyl-[acyl-carrier protein] reductase
MDLGLTGKKVLVTGASRGIGYAISEHFLQENADVFLVARNEDRLYKTEEKFNKQFGEKRAHAQTCDCVNPDDLKKLKTSIKANWGNLDIVVANVGDGQSVSDPIPCKNEWEKTWDANFETALQTARTFLPMLQESHGCLLFISSITAFEAFGAPVDYSTAKAAIVAFSKNLARKVADKVRVNVLAPGNIYFPGGSWDKKIHEDPVKIELMIKDFIPMKRFGTPKEIADAAVFLCSNRSSFITGSVLVVDGGQTVGIY